MPTRFAQHLLFLAQSERELTDRWGYHIRPVHYYEPLPDFSSITRQQIDRRRNYAALEFNLEQQLVLLDQLASHYQNELRELNGNSFNFQNGYFGGFDAAVYYSLIRQMKPRQVIEIGGGFSTRLASMALSRNRAEGSDGRIVCIEPDPGPRLDQLEGEIELIAKPVQEVDVEFFSSLQAGDVLFIDSTHTVKFGSDVCYELLEILPTLKAGVWVHVHDIFFPHDYPAEWLLDQRLALNEQYLLEAFLAFNRDYSVALSNCWISTDYPEEAAALWCITSSEPKPSSFWMKRTQ